ncbi:hypothetical protein SAMN05421505_106202 [Sinosporangium album]|uniref:SAF domain-containing protein n=1 Tax=Sinosporangium album TaxID=504805 RepID=A0A1G7W5J9_9ACTN|nr:hypothetical protein [Sinosporangium album]SDG67059.1 hypothetical protein SAMN05421505_106202 [Sinosporangium album]
MRTSERPVRDGRTPQGGGSGQAKGAPGGLSGPASRKLPVPPRERKPALAALAVLLILGGALATTLLVLRSGDRVSAIRISAQVGAGQPFTPEVLEEVQIADTGIGYVSFAEREEVMKTFARVTLLPGTLLTEEMTVRESEELGPGKAIVGLALKPGQVPAGLDEGDRVQVIFVPGRNGAGEQPKVLAQAALVHRVPSEGRGNGVINVIVASSAAPTITLYASSGEIALAELPGAR